MSVRQRIITTDRCIFTGLYLIAQEPATFQTDSDEKVSMLQRNFKPLENNKGLTVAGSWSIKIVSIKFYHSNTPGMYFSIKDS